MKIIKNEPVLVQSLVQAVLGLFLAFGVDLNNEQTGSIMAVVAVILAVVARMAVTPNTKVLPVEIVPTPPAAGDELPPHLVTDDPPADPPVV